jgi:C-terminal processing protease CtpA/Prc
MMKCLPRVTTVGMRTRGASGNPQPYELYSMGVSVWFSRWVDLMPDGSIFEGVGIAPDVTVEVPPASYTERDPTLEKGLEVLRKQLKKKTPGGPRAGG